MTSLEDHENKLKAAYEQRIQAEEIRKQKAKEAAQVKRKSQKEEKEAEEKNLEKIMSNKLLRGQMGHNGERPSQDPSNRNITRKGTRGEAKS